MLELFHSPTAGPFGRRLKRERGGRIPVMVVTGFLGAGKTTLMRHFLSLPEGAGTAVIVNEFGEARIDDVLLRHSSDNIALIGNGCLCCTVRSDLQMTLRRLVADRDQGIVPYFGRVVIETSGLADPSPILTTFATDRALGGEFHVEAVVAVVAADNGAATIADFAEARRQIILADRIVIAKTDIAGEDAPVVLRRTLRELNPRAHIIEAVFSRLDPQWILAEGTSAFSTGFITESATHTDDIASFTLIEEEPVVWSAFARAMEALMALRGDDLLRVKGFLNVAGCRGPVVVQFVRHLAHPPVELERWPGHDRRSRVVFITRNLSEPQVKTLFGAMRALAKDGPRGQ
ncbi:MAG TPA: GTP-binding protein [Xanthobacteraceae bacterium]|nr:GTP-binding protein [Xanthobacteraceae bacterium]